MTASYSTRMHLIIPAGTDAADINTIISNWNKLDGTSGLILCTSSTRPTTNLFPGLFIKETDTLKHYYLDGTGSWVGSVYSGAAWVEDYYYYAVSGGGNVIDGTVIPADVSIPATTTVAVVTATGATVTFTTPAINTKIVVDVSATPVLSADIGNIVTLFAKVDSGSDTQVARASVETKAGGGGTTPALVPQQTICGKAFFVVATAGVHTVTIGYTGVAVGSAASVMSKITATVTQSA